MAYDKTSFLAGMAVGRNLASWPVQEAGEDYNAFRFEINISSTNYVTPDMVLDGVINWGDGTSEEVHDLPSPHGWNYMARVRHSHTYPRAGRYTISLVGDLSDFSTVFDPASTSTNTDRTMTAVLTPFPKSMKDRKNFDGTFRGASSLAKVPNGLFLMCGVTTAKNFFYDCLSLAELPENLLEGCDELTDISGMFGGCPLENIPAGLFADSPNVEIASKLFYRQYSSANDLIIPQGLFDPLQNLTDVSYMFANSISAHGQLVIPFGLFANCPKIVNMSSLFQESALSSIPDDILDYCPLVENVGGMFSGTPITRIPAGLFDRCPNITDFTTVFSGTQITRIPAGLFDRCPNADNFSGAFAETEITSIPSGLFDHCPRVERFIGTFRSCESLASIPSGLFNSCNSVLDFNTCFMWCIHVEGLVPELWESHPDADGSYCFYDCYMASNYGDIPPEWGGPSQ